MTNKKIFLIGVLIIILILLVWFVESDMNCTDDGCESFYYESK